MSEEKDIYVKVTVVGKKLPGREGYDHLILGDGISLALIKGSDYQMTRADLCQVCKKPMLKKRWCCNKCQN